VRQFTAQQVKLAVTGYGAASKVQVQGMVARLCGLAEIPKPADAADALALAITYFMMVRMERHYPAEKARMIGWLEGHVLAPPRQRGGGARRAGCRLRGARSPPPRSFRPGESLELFVYTVVRADAILLYGFLDYAGPRVLRDAPRDARSGSRDRAGGTSYGVEE